MARSRGNSRAPASIGSSIVWFGAAYGVTIVAYLLLNALASRLTTPEHFGRFLVILTATNLIGQLGLVGVHRAGLREAARLDPDSEEGRRELTALRSGVLAVSVVSLPAVSVLTGVVAWVLTGAERSGEAILEALLTAALVYLGAQQKVVASYLRGLGQVRFAGLLEGRSGGALVALAQAALVGLVWVTLPDSGIDGALTAVMLGYLIPLVPAYVVLGRRWGGGRAGRTRPGDEERAGLWSTFVTVARRDWKFAVGQSGGFANSSIDLWVASWLLPGLPTSLFGAAQRLSQLVLIPSTSLQVVFSPAISRLSHQGERRRLQHLLRTGSSIAVLGSGLLALPLLVAPEAILTRLFGPAYDAAVPILVWLTVGYCMNAVSGLSGITLSMSHHEGTVATVQWITVVVRAAGAVVAALVSGIVAVAIWSALSTVVMYALMWWQARRLVGVSTHATLRPRVRLLTRIRG